MSDNLICVECEKVFVLDGCLPSDLDGSTILCWGCLHKKNKELQKQVEGNLGKVRVIRVHHDASDQQYCAWDSENNWEGWGSTPEEAIGMMLVSQHTAYGIKFSGMEKLGYVSISALERELGPPLGEGGAS